MSKINEIGHTSLKTPHSQRKLHTTYIGVRVSYLNKIKKKMDVVMWCIAIVLACLC